MEKYTFTRKFKDGDKVKTVLENNEYFYNKNGVVVGTSSTGENNEYGFKYIVMLDGMNQGIHLTETQLELDI